MQRLISSRALKQGGGRRVRSRVTPQEVRGLCAGRGEAGRCGRQVESKYVLYVEKETCIHICTHTYVCIYAHTRTHIM